MATLVDSHVHLDRYADDEVAAMLARATAAGVGRLLTIGVDVATSHAALALAARHPNVLAAVGIHPTRLVRADQDAATLQDGGTAEHLLANLLAASVGRAAAVGEVGLDEQAPDLARQQRFLAACFVQAERHALPLVLHVVGPAAVHEAALEIVRQHPRVRSVAHYFVGGPDLAQRYVEHGCWISVGRPVTRPSEAAVRAAVSSVPLDRLVFETDTYPLPGRTTEPRDVTTVCTAVSALTGRSYAEVAATTTTNFARFIGNAPARSPARVRESGE